MHTAPKLECMPNFVLSHVHVFQVHLGYRPHDEANVDVRSIAFETQGFPGAQLGSLVNTAASLAGKAGREFILQRDLQEVCAGALHHLSSYAGKPLSEHQRHAAGSCIYPVWWVPAEAIPRGVRQMASHAWVAALSVLLGCIHRGESSAHAAAGVGG